MNTYEIARNKALTGIQNYYIHKRVQRNTATKRSMSAPAFDMLRNSGLLKGMNMLFGEYAGNFKDSRRKKTILPALYGSAMLGLSAVGFTCICLNIGKNWVDNEELWSLYKAPKKTL